MEESALTKDTLHKANGPLLLLAGPGTGKTYRLGRRAKFLVEEAEVAPEEIAIITFTAAAAANMREQISDPDETDLFIPSSLQPDTIRTMHSLGYSILRQHAGEVDLPEDITVIGADRTRSILLGDAAQLAGYERHRGEAVDECRRVGACEPEDTPKCEVCGVYRKMLRSCGAVDYDDQILLACDLLEQNHQVASEWRAKCRHLLVDEYQDINASQFRLIRLLAAGQEDGLFAVGDDDQSIYRAMHFARVGAICCSPLIRPGALCLLVYQVMFGSAHDTLPRLLRTCEDLLRPTSGSVGVAECGGCSPLPA